MASRPIDDLLRDVLTCVRLRRPIAAFGFDGEPGAGEPWATYVQPGVDAWETCGHQYYFGFEERERIVAAGGGHRVLVRTGGSDLEIMALLRHELRHAEQHEHDAYFDLIAGVLAKGLLTMYGDTVAFRTLYAAIPAERDANAAARDFVEARASEGDLLALRARHGTLLATGSARFDLNSLRDRTLVWGVSSIPRCSKGLVSWLARRAAKAPARSSRPRCSLRCSCGHVLWHVGRSWPTRSRSLERPTKLPRCPPWRPPMQRWATGRGRSDWPTASGSSKRRRSECRDLSRRTCSWARQPTVTSVCATSTIAGWSNRRPGTAVGATLESRSSTGGAWAVAVASRACALLRLWSFEVSATSLVQCLFAVARPASLGRTFLQDLAPCGAARLPPF